VRVTGTNGGEILRSLVAFKPVSLCTDPLDPDLARLTSASAVTYEEELRGHRLSFTAFKQAPWYMGSKFLLERSKITLRMPYFDNDLVALAYQAPQDREASRDACLRIITDGNPALRKVETDQGGLLWPIPGAARVQRLFQEFTYKAEYAYDYGMPHWLARLDHAFASLHLERLFLGRHKFHHFRVFYRDELSHYLKAILLDPRTLSRPYFRAGALAEMVNAHLQGNRNYTREIHKLLAVELIQRELIERN
jgi:asparagine synthase (glutamine-hydrolysing)